VFPLDRRQDDGIGKTTVIGNKIQLLYADAYELYINTDRVKNHAQFVLLM